MKAFFDDITRYTDLNHPIQRTVAMVLIAAVLFLVFMGVRRLVVGRLTKTAPLTRTPWDDVFSGFLKTTKKFFIAALSLLIASEVLPPMDKSALWVHRLVFLALIVQLSLWGGLVITIWVDRSHDPSDMAKATTMRAIGFIVRLCLYVTLLLWALDNFGVNITALVTGLGVGGIAVALAVQNILGDLFASLTIVLDKPFVIGDYIVVTADHQGTIEHIGLKTTRVRSLTGEQLIFPNADLLQSRIRNFRRMQERRQSFFFGVTYDTPAEKLREIPTAVKKIVEAEAPLTRFERAHFTTFASSSLNFEVVFWTMSPDLKAMMDVHQKINIALLEYCAREQIEFAFPTQTVYQYNYDGTPTEA